MKLDYVSKSIISAELNYKFGKEPALILINLINFKLFFHNKIYI